ncbi:MAG: leucine-rich repeat domain-containing protein, partial [Stomatobaculum longum]|nr:leucine-rich repeat domain-containing protein [Stomatobaculum longum]
DNTALESLRIFGYEGGVQIGGYNSTVRDTAALMQLSHCKALRELRLNHCGLTDLAFASGLSNLEILDVSGNRIEDVSPLTGLTKLRLFLSADNAIQNIAVLRGRDLVVSE